MVKVNYWYVGVSGSDTTITVPILEDQYGGSETMFYQVHVFAAFGQEAVSNIMPLYLDPCGDGEVNILDIISLVNLIFVNEYEDSGDLNADEEVNILDVVALVSIILGN